MTWQLRNDKHIYLESDNQYMLSTIKLNMENNGLLEYIVITYKNDKDLYYTDMPFNYEDVRELFIYEKEHKFIVETKYYNKHPKQWYELYKDMKKNYMPYIWHKQQKRRISSFDF